MDENSNKQRNYIRRKHCLRECVKIIKMSLSYVAKATGNPISDKQLQEAADNHSKSIEAVCWAPRVKMTDEEYSALMLQKTKELCRVLIQPVLFNMRNIKIQNDLKKIQKPDQIAKNKDDNLVFQKSQFSTQNPNPNLVRATVPDTKTVVFQQPDFIPVPTDYDDLQTKYDLICHDPISEIGEWGFNRPLM